ncbi:MAG: hypothetical protein AAFX56_02955 [Pseudomonadota bacterium]
MYTKQAATGITLLAAALLALHAGTAEAHGQHKPHYDWHVDVAYGHGPQRSKHMPAWLHRQKHFRKWYRHSHVKHKRYLSWRKVYRIYQRHMRYYYAYDDRRYRGRHHDRDRRYEYEYGRQYDGRRDRRHKRRHRDDDD